jgi:hypothetical protein
MAYNSLAAGELQTEYERMLRLPPKANGWAPDALSIANSQILSGAHPPPYAPNMAAGQQASANSKFSDLNMSANSKFSDLNMSAMISIRMGWNMSNPSCTLARVTAHKLNAEQAVVFVIVDGKALLIHDDLNLFPSDALVTQLRLLEKN